MHRFAWQVVVASVMLSVAIFVAVAKAHANARETRADAGSLVFKAELPVTYPRTACATGTPDLVECFTRTGSGVVRGLGNVDESYSYLVQNSPAGCSADQVRVLPTTVRLRVVGKGDIEFQVGGTGCVTRVFGNPLQAEAEFAITGGSGRYAEASGGGTYVDLSTGPPAYKGRDTWTGTLVVSGLSFDLTPPRLTGAASRTIRVPRRVKRVRVAHSVAAHDDVDGVLPVTCQPRSGSRFRVGRTRVRCSATDSSANQSTKTFVITVKRGR